RDGVPLTFDGNHDSHRMSRGVQLSRIFFRDCDADLPPEAGGSLSQHSQLGLNSRDIGSLSSTSNTAVAQCLRDRRSVAHTHSVRQGAYSGASSISKVG